MKTCIALISLALCAAAQGQGINLDLNSHYGTPSDSWPAASGQDGRWNVSDGQGLTLLGLDGQPSDVSLTFPNGAGGSAFVNAPFLDGDVHALLDDGRVVPDVVQNLRFEGLEPGEYDIYAYGAPFDQGYQTLFLFTAGGQDTSENTTGGWNGMLEEGVNYAHVTVNVTDGTLVVGWVSGFFGDSGWISGVQIVPAACEADINGDGDLNILDFVAFQELFSSGDPGADCNGDEQLNILDFVCFQELFAAGCA